MEFEEHSCCGCFVKFNVPAGFTAARRGDKRGFYCPNGHVMSYRESDLDRMRRERDNLKQQAARRDDDIARERADREAAERRSVAAGKKVKRVEKRAHAGLCPCCNRSFAELARHVATKHPGFWAQDTNREKVVPVLKARA